MSADVLVLGGGIAGLAAAHALAVRGLSVALVEREPALATQASARNAAIYLPVEHDAVSMALAVRQAALLDALDLESPWLRRTGALLVSEAEHDVAEIAQSAEAGGLAAERVDAGALYGAAPVLRDGDARFGLHVAAAGVLDVHAICEGLAARLRGLHVLLRTGTPAEVRVTGGRATGVRLESGETLAADGVVLAGGAWTAELAERAGAPLPLVPLRRHLFFLDAALPSGTGHPVVWRAGDDTLACYFRSEGGGVLASPCDEVPMAPMGEPPVAPEAAEALAHRLGRLAPALASAGVRRAWACQRTFAPDRLPVAGGDPRVRGLFVLSGLGGQGMTVGLAVAEVLAARVTGDGHRFGAALAPARLLGGPARRAEAG